MFGDGRSQCSTILPFYYHRKRCCVVDKHLGSGSYFDLLPYPLELWFHIQLHVHCTTPSISRGKKGLFHQTMVIFLLFSTRQPFVESE